MTVTASPAYNFRLAPEAMWLLLNTILGAILVSLISTDFAAVSDWKAWAIGFGLSALRTALGAILAAATGGAFLKPGETPTTPTTG